MIEKGLELSNDHYRKLSKETYKPKKYFYLLFWWLGNIVGFFWFIPISFMDGLYIFSKEITHLFIFFCEELKK